MIKKIIKISIFILRKFTPIFLLEKLIRIDISKEKIQVKDILISQPLYYKIFFKDEITLNIPYKGLGDHLFYSPLPEKLIKQKVFKKVYISSTSNYRFNDIKSLVWELNPFISGFKNSFLTWRHSGIRPLGGNFIDGMDQYFGLNNIYSLNKSPKVYYQPRIRSFYLHYFVFDLNAFSNTDLPSLRKVCFYIKKLNCKKLIFFKSSFVNKLIKFDLSFFLSSNYIIIDYPKSIFEYCNIIKSCKKFYCFYSGPNSLSPALKISANVLCKKYDPAQSYSINNYILIK